MKKTKTNWFDNKNLLDVLIFVLPPLGLFGIYKNENISIGKKMLLICIGVINLLLLISLAFRDISI
jgi:hypothetical protein